MLDLNALPLPDLFVELTSDGSLDRVLAAAFDEDLQSVGDITTDSIIDPSLHAEARIRARQAGIASGAAALQRICGAGIVVHPESGDGETLAAGATLARLRGPLREILRIERTALNLLGRMSGIATVTRRYVDAIAGTEAVICDTRKTTPGLRSLEKYAVRCGGGHLHRSGLYDAALYKDNHLALVSDAALAETVAAAAGAVRRRHDVRFIEVEVDSINQFERLLTVDEGLIDIILLDNLNAQSMTEAVRLRDERRPALLLEASGGITLANVRAAAETGVDRISVGALTHSAVSLDLGLDLTNETPARSG